MRVLRVNPTGEFAGLGALFFLQWMGLAAWMVPLTLVLNAHGLQVIQPFAFATSAVAAFVSPLFFGAVADRRAGPVRVLRGLSLAAAASLALASFAIRSGWNAWLVLALIQVYSLCASPTTSLSTTIALSRSRDPRRQYGPIRGMGTIGWMAGCWLVSAMNADNSTLAGFSSAAIWFGLAAFTFLLPDVKPPEFTGQLTLRQRFGLDALSLLRQSDNRAIYLVACLICIPLAAFYPFTPLHMSDLGLQKPAAWMSLGQITELVAMFTLAALLVRCRLKWILTAGLAFGVLRYAFYVLNTKTWLLIGVVLHGITYTLIFTTAQIYVNERVDAAWRARAQALLSLMTSGVGHLLGYIGCGWWFAACTQTGVTRWPLFWGALAVVVAGVTIYFLVAYHGRGAIAARNKPEGEG